MSSQTKFERLLRATELKQPGRPPYDWASDEPYLCPDQSEILAALEDITAKDVEDFPGFLVPKMGDQRVKVIGIIAPGLSMDNYQFPFPIEVRIYQHLEKIIPAEKWFEPEISINFDDYGIRDRNESESLVEAITDPTPFYLGCSPEFHETLFRIRQEKQTEDRLSYNDYCPAAPNLADIKPLTPESRAAEAERAIACVRAWENFKAGIKPDPTKENIAPIFHFGPRIDYLVTALGSPAAVLEAAQRLIHKIGMKDEWPVHQDDPIKNALLDNMEKGRQGYVPHIHNAVLALAHTLRRDPQMGHTAEELIQTEAAHQVIRREVFEEHLKKHYPTVYKT